MKANPGIAKVCGLLLLSCVVGDAQSKRRSVTQRAGSSESTRGRKLIETVKTSNGREIQLFDDLTYKVIGSAQRSQAAIELRVRAGMITKQGAVQAVSQTQFKIFSEDIKPLLSMINDREGKPMNIFTFYIYRRALEKLKPITLTTFTTDAQGNGLSHVPRSDKPSYIYGRFSIGGSSCVWYIEFTSTEDTSFVLDNSNSALCE